MAVTETDQLHVCLPAELVRLVKSKVESGQYASESDVIEEALGNMWEQEQPFEAWLRDEVAPTYDRMQQDPSRARSVAEVRESLSQTAERMRNNGR